MEKSDARAERTGIVFGRHSTTKREFAWQFRRAMTGCERILWDELRASRLCGLHFRRQQIIDGFIVDFFCLSAALIVEVDGPVHDFRAVEDVAREMALRRRNLHIVRFTNAQVSDDLAGVLSAIREACLRFS
jgi:very-short-patch-repair endonuclease